MSNYDYDKAQENWARKKAKKDVIVSLNGVLSNRRSEINRSDNWPYASTYPEARAISPFPDMPVR